MNIGESIVKQKYEARGWEVLSGDWPDFLMRRGKEIMGVKVKTGADTTKPEQRRMREALVDLGIPLLIEKVSQVDVDVVENGRRRSDDEETRHGLVERQAREKEKALIQNPVGRPRLVVLRSRFKTLWLEGKTCDEIASKLGISRTSVYLWRREMGLPRRHELGLAVGDGGVVTTA